MQKFQVNILRMLARLFRFKECLIASKNGQGRVIVEGWASEDFREDVAGRLVAGQNRAARRRILNAHGN